MAEIFDIETDEVIQLGDFISYMDSLGSYPLDNYLPEIAVMLRKLCNQRTFLIDSVTNDLSDWQGFINKHPYTSQVFLLHSSEHYTLRFCIWEPIVGKAGENVFFYGDPHDHNFKLLTVGYSGPGYVTDIYNYQNDEVTGTVGEPVNVEFQDRIVLKYKRVLLIDESSDIHVQLPPDEFSISLNVIQNRATDPNNQYTFDISQSASGLLKANVKERLTQSEPEILAKLFNGDINDIEGLLKTELTHETKPTKKSCLEYALANAGAQLDQ